LGYHSRLDGDPNFVARDAVSYSFIQGHPFDYSTLHEDQLHSVAEQRLERLRRNIDSGKPKF
jgi:hypothetical protein